jgi:hypothetical protein
LKNAQSRGIGIPRSLIVSQIVFSSQIRCTP